MQGTFWALLPPVIAIILALWTKEVYISLMLGIITGALFYTDFNVIKGVEITFDIMDEKIGANVDILIFLVLIGIIVALITSSGASKAYGNWATKTIKSKRGALLATSCLGALIFVDDYFNCLTVGTVMRPVTDRAKLAYIIDATAAPICIIAPISSWAAAVGSSLPNDSKIDGFSLFLRTIPYNMYAIFTVIFVLFIIITGIDFAKMKKYEEVDKEEKNGSSEEIEVVGNGKVKDLVLPIVFLIVSCIVAMLYTGGLFKGESVVDAFANCSSSRALVLGSFFTIIFTFLLYVPRKVISFSDFCSSFTNGFKAMTPAILILCMAWTLSGVCSDDYLNIGGFVSSVVNTESAVGGLLPMLFFLISVGLAFATGTSWGTFGILIPIAIAVFGNGNMLVICVASILSGAVCGDHISPISDTTIMASAGAQCNHVNHVSTQLPYAMTVAAVSCITYVIAGILQNAVICLVIGIALQIGVLLAIKAITKDHTGRVKTTN
mgnify:CR=1 FL=1